jgi:hypothetical protein
VDSHAICLMNWLTNHSIIKFMMRWNAF